MGIYKKSVSEIVHNKTFVSNFIVIFSFLLPLVILYILYPNSFQYTWRARAQYLIFLWLFLLELALAWRQLQSRLTSAYTHRRRTAAALLAMTIPTAYVFATSLFGLDFAVVELGKIVGVPYERFGDFLVQEAWPVVFEYVVMAASFTSIILLTYARTGLRKTVIAQFFLWATVFFHIIDTFAPYGLLWGLQAFVPFTASSSAAVLRLLGYNVLTRTIANGHGPGVLLATLGEGTSFAAVVYWPSAGIQSLFIYTLTILLFVERISISLSRRMIYISVGAVGTFIVNTLRIASICIIGLKVGSAAAQHFHDYYGELFFISWMLLYLAIAVSGSRIVARTRALIHCTIRLRGHSLRAS